MDVLEPSNYEQAGWSDLTYNYVQHLRAALESMQEKLQAAEVQTALAVERAREAEFENERWRAAQGPFDECLLNLSAILIESGNFPDPMRDGSEDIAQDYKNACNNVFDGVQSLIARALTAEVVIREDAATIKRLRDALDEISAVVGCIEGRDAIDLELVRNIKDSISALAERRDAMTDFHQYGKYLDAKSWLYRAGPTDEERETAERLAQEKAAADAAMAHEFANLQMPEDIRRRAKEWGMEAFCEVLWANGFQAGWRERQRTIKGDTP